MKIQKKLQGILAIIKANIPAFGHKVEIKYNYKKERIEVMGSYTCQPNDKSQGGDVHFTTYISLYDMKDISVQLNGRNSYDLNREHLVKEYIENEIIDRLEKL